MKHQRWWHSAKVLAATGAVLACLSGPGAAVAATMEGQAIEISGLNTFNATASQQTSKGLGRILLILGGVGSMIFGAMTQRPGTAVGGAGLSIGGAFVPGSVSSAMDAAPAATSLWAAVPAEYWWTPFTVFTLPVTLPLRIVQAPDTALAFLVVLYLAHKLIQRRQACGALAR